MRQKLHRAFLCGVLIGVILATLAFAVRDFTREQSRLEQHVERIEQFLSQVSR